MGQQAQEAPGSAIGKAWGRRSGRIRSPTDCPSNPHTVCIANNFLRRLRRYLLPVKYGHDIENWALFEPFQIANLGAESILATDPDLQRALQLHGLRSAGLRMLLPPSGQFNGPM